MYYYDVITTRSLRLRKYRNATRQQQTPTPPRLAYRHLAQAAAALGRARLRPYVTRDKIAPAVAAAAAPTVIGGGSELMGTEFSGNVGPAGLEGKAQGPRGGPTSIL